MGAGDWASLGLPFSEDSLTTLAGVCQRCLVECTTGPY